MTTISGLTITRRLDGFLMISKGDRDLAQAFCAQEGETCEDMMEKGLVPFDVYEGRMLYVWECHAHAVLNA